MNKKNKATPLGLSFISFASHKAIPRHR